MGFHVRESEVTPVQDPPLASVLTGAPPLLFGSSPHTPPYSEASVHHTFLPPLRARNTPRPSQPALLPERKVERGEVGEESRRGPR